MTACSVLVNPPGAGPDFTVNKASCLRVLPHRARDLIRVHHPTIAVLVDGSLLNDLILDALWLVVG